MSAIVFLLPPQISFDVMIDNFAAIQIWRIAKNRIVFTIHTKQERQFFPYNIWHNREISLTYELVEIPSNHMATYAIGLSTKT